MGVFGPKISAILVRQGRAGPAQSPKVIARGPSALCSVQHLQNLELARGMQAADARGQIARLGQGAGAGKGDFSRPGGPEDLRRRRRVAPLGRGGALVGLAVVYAAFRETGIRARVECEGPASRIGATGAFTGLQRCIEQRLQIGAIEIRIARHDEPFGRQGGPVLRAGTLG